ncbi:MAG: hypothetical protein A2176_08715 [Spirochaetes bacterium RBG_13_51_14]|nr:MAG: hypothetical protein A2176_08715 [Spirochaetes bacterium RBG_13_51_14]
MLESRLSHLVEPLREMIYQYDVIINGFRERSGARVAGMTCDILPPEIAASLGLVPVRLPSFITGRCVAAGLSDIPGLEKIYDCIIVPGGCAGRESMPALGVPVHEFRCPAGWGGESSRSMAATLDALLLQAGAPGLRALDAGTLRTVTEEYNALRRLIRGITTARKDKPRLLSCRDLAAVHEAACVLPPSAIAGFLASILDALNRATDGGADGMVPALAYASFIGDAAVLDHIEEAGCLIADDDACGGRRQFDMSYQHASPDLFGEILDAFSYRPRCPSVRTAEERIQLFYAMIKDQHIELVIFIEDLCCPARMRDIETLRVRLMRAGVDPVVVTAGNAFDKIREYVSRY